MCDGVLGNGVTKLAAGWLRPEQVTVEYSEHNAFIAAAAQQAVIERQWTEFTRTSRTHGRATYDGALVRLASFEIAAHGMIIYTGPARYSAYIAARELTIAGHERPDPIGTSVIVETADGCVVVGRRSARMVHNPGRYFGFGGLCDPIVDRDAHGHIDLFASAARELREESGIEVDPRQMICVGLFYDCVNPHPELCFFVKAQMAAEQLLQTMVADEAEIASLRAIPVTSLRDFIEQHEPDICETFVEELRAFLEQKGL